MGQASQSFSAPVIVFHSKRSETVRQINQPVQAAPIDPLAELPDLSLVERLGAILCLRHQVLPWRDIGGATVILCIDVNIDDALRQRLQETFGRVRLALCGAKALNRALGHLCGETLARQSETTVPRDMSCRSWRHDHARWVAAAVVTVMAGMSFMAPVTLLSLVFGWAVATLLLNAGLKFSAALAMLRPVERDSPATVPPTLARLPVVSILVPLYHEKEVASHIIRRLDALDYPRHLLDVCLIVEDDDNLTRAALEQTTLPDWAQVIEVPEGTLRTKPRALNYAMMRARGSIVGIYDAEDAPEAHQLRKVVQRFAERPPEVACLQGQLDYYNPRSNWIARCFTLEYAIWFRVLLPGMERLGLVIPLGGTTLFLRRQAIEAVGGWDAHNVTEDADLGVRLARAGYRTEVIETVTMEEANARAWPWVRQRSRWLKGYAMTYAVHMSHPLKLLADLGLERFLGVNLLFLGTLSAFVLAPVLWSFWLVLLGLPHPLDGLVARQTLAALGIGFLTLELLNIALAAYAARKAGQARLALWAPAMQAYFPLATIAAYKGLIELLYQPFFWDKTEHGIDAAPLGEPLTLPPQPLPRPASAE